MSPVWGEVFANGDCSSGEHLAQLSRYAHGGMSLCMTALRGVPNAPSEISMTQPPKLTNNIADENHAMTKFAGHGKHLLHLDDVFGNVPLEQPMGGAGLRAPE